MKYQTSYNLGASLIFSFLLLLGIALTLGPGLEFILISIAVVPLANLTFLKWETGAPFQRIISISSRGLVLAFLLFCAVVAFVKFGSSGGQVGYGDRLQIDGNEITWLGYQILLIGSLKVSAVASAAAVLVPIGLVRS